MLTILPYRQILNFAKTDDLTISKYAQERVEVYKDRKKRRILIAMIAIGILYSLFLWNVAKSDFDSLADVSPQYTVRVFTNFGADDQSLVPGNPVTEEVSISNLGNYDAYARLYLQSIFDVTNPDSMKDIVTAQTAEKVLTGTISYKFVRRNAVDTD